MVWEVFFLIPPVINTVLGLLCQRWFSREIRKLLLLALHMNTITAVFSRWLTM